MDRKLVPNRRESGLVCKVFSLYLELGSCPSWLRGSLGQDLEQALDHKVARESAVRFSLVA